MKISNIIFLILLCVLVRTAYSEDEPNSLVTKDKAKQAAEAFDALERLKPDVPPADARNREFQSDRKLIASNKKKVDCTKISPLSDGTKSHRVKAQIQCVFSNNESLFYVLFARASRERKINQYRVTISLEIEPTGSVSEVYIKSSTPEDLDLNRKIIKRVKQITWPNQAVEKWVGNYDISYTSE